MNKNAREALKQLREESNWEATIKIDGVEFVLIETSGKDAEDIQRAAAKLQMSTSAISEWK